MDLACYSTLLATQLSSVRQRQDGHSKLRIGPGDFLRPGENSGALSRRSKTYLPSRRQRPCRPMRGSMRPSETAVVRLVCLYDYRCYSRDTNAITEGDTDQSAYLRAVLPDALANLELRAQVGGTRESPDASEAPISCCPAAYQNDRQCTRALDARAQKRQSFSALHARLGEPVPGRNNVTIPKAANLPNYRAGRCSSARYPRHIYVPHSTWVSIWRRRAPLRSKPSPITHDA